MKAESAKSRPPEGKPAPLTTAPPPSSADAASTVPSAGDIASPLRAALDKVIAEHGGSLKDLTVLAPQRDPFRLDTPANHTLGRWLAETMRELGIGNRRIHLRGLHYMMLGRPKPDGTAYANADDDWVWMSEKAAKAARWLGYVRFDQIVDQRNAEPVIREFRYPEPSAYLSTSISVEIPYDIEPELYTSDFRGVQPYHLVMIGEKSSLADDLGPLAGEFGADLYLPTGEMSDTLIWRIGEMAVRDGRPMVVLYFSDCDPAGWQMILSVSRKLMALKVLLPAMPDFEAYRAALTPAQVGEYGLPSTPLKDTEKRADKWRQAMGVQQTEVDAFTARPGLLRQIARDALSGFYDHTLVRRVDRYRDEWLSRAQDIIAATFDLGRLAEIRRGAEEQLAGMRQQVRELNDALRIDVDPSDLPPIELPGAIDPGSNGMPSTPGVTACRCSTRMPLLDSRWDFAEQCRALIASKAYENGET